MTHYSFRHLALGLVTALSLQNAWAVVSQEPLLNKAVNVRPNLALVLDTSGSMGWECVYAKHVIDAFVKESQPLAGLTGPCLRGDDDKDDIRQVSPVNNLLFYNPKTSYGPGYAGGLLKTPAALSSASVVTLYLPKPTRDPTTYTTSAAIKDPANYDKYEVRTDRFVKNGVSVGIANPFPSHNGSRKDCAADPCTLAEERRNITNWRAAHQSRMSAAKTGLSGAFSSQSDNFRLGYGDIYGTPNTMTDFGVAKPGFYTWLDGRISSGNTPLRGALDRVGKYFSSTDNTGPWGATPWSPPAGETSASHLSCRRSYTLMITDGFYNDAAPTGIGNTDGTLGTKHTFALDSTKTYQYKPGDAVDIRNRGKSDTPSGGGTSDTLADIALKYWSNDLRGDLLNDNGKATPSDPPFWQNMTSYMVSFGALGSMTEAAVNSAKSGTLSWATPVTNERTTIDDMRHSAHNGGGEFLTVTNAEQFSTDLGNLIGSISGQQLSQAGVAASAVTLTAGTKKFVPYYTSGSWWGNVHMVDLAANGDTAGTVWQVVATDANGQPTGATTLPTPATRKIGVWVNAATQAVDFNFTNVSAAVNTLRGTNANMQLSTAVSSDVVDFLRGVRTKEGSGLRKRQAVLGDIVNSTPTFIKNNTDPQFEKLPATTPGLSTYSAYIKDKAARAEGVLFVGANDGMVHAFAEGAGAKVGGREIYAYMPRSVLGKVEALANISYGGQHVFTVDGPLSEADAYVSVPNLTTAGVSTRWTNLVLGTTGAGAKAVFALNVSDPLGLNNKAVLWEINPDPAFPVMPGNATTSFAELGHVLSPVQSGITASGDWVSVFGNGYDSKSGKASLFIVESGSGRLIREIQTDAVVGNGLGGVRLVLNSKQQVIGAYAGDLKGRLWKFDLSSITSAGWALGNGGAPLFSATSGGLALPITAQPGIIERTDQPVYMPSYLVSFGTGKLFEAGDPSATTPTQAAYGLWDRKAFGSIGADSIIESQLEPLKAGLVTAAIDPATGTSINGGGITNFYNVGYTDPTVTQLDWKVRRGWKLNLDVFAGQRTIYPVQMIGKIVKIDTVAPDGNVSSCKASNSNALSFYIDPLAGTCRKGGTLDTNADKKIDASDANVCAYTSSADGMDVVLRVLDSKGNDTNLVDVQNSAGHIQVRVEDPPPLPPPPNTNISNRSWRQLFPRAN